MSNFQGIRVVMRLMAAVTLSLLGAFGASAQTVRYLHTDGLGSVVLITDKDRNPVERSEYEPYGSLLSHPIEDGPGYTGHIMDAATELTYMQQRYYDQKVGIFLSVDPVVVDTVKTSNFNRYVYANNNPYRFNDPDGRASWDIISDSFRVEVGLGPQLEIKGKIGKIVKAEVGLGSMRGGFGATVADGYTFEEGRGPSLGVTIGDKFQIGRSASSNRSEQGRYGVPFTEKIEKGEWKLGWKQGSGDASIGDSGTEVSAKVSAIVIGVEAKLDFGQLMYGVFVAKPGEEPAQKTEAETQWNQYKSKYGYGSQ
ncbi:hypothetical protein NB717_000428 [Xanthomonas sacchari]|nr:hypothetical protein [Xanthomonas sacchari]